MLHRDMRGVNDGKLVPVGLLNAGWTQNLKIVKNLGSGKHNKIKLK